MKRSYLIIICLFFIFIFTTLYLSLNNKKIYNTEDMVGKKINEVELVLFDSNRDISENFGAIGSIIGHEMTHGFDDQGKKFDGDLI